MCSCIFKHGCTGPALEWWADRIFWKLSTDCVILLDLTGARKRSAITQSFLFLLSGDFKVFLFALDVGWFHCILYCLGQYDICFSIIIMIAVLGIEFRTSGL
jgi:hypothetical protein